MEEFHEVLDYLEWNFDCRILIITGMGKGFCAGLDLKEMPVIRKGKSERYPHHQFLNMHDPIKSNFYAQKWIADLIVKIQEELARTGK